MGMLSQRTSVRLAPLEPVARKETPCVVGFATRLELRRNKLKPGIWRSRSSMFMPGMFSICSRSRTVMEAGVSADSVSFTVTVVFRGGGLVSSWVCDVERVGAACAQLKAGSMDATRTPQSAFMRETGNLQDCR